MKTNTLKFYILLTMQRHLLAWYKIKKAYYKTFYTYMRVPEYVPELFFYKLYLQNKVSNRARTCYSFFSYVNIKKAVYFCIYSQRLKIRQNIKKSESIMTTIANKSNTLKIREFSIANSKYEIFFTVKTDHQFSFESQAEPQCKTVSQKLNVLLQVVWSLNFPQKIFYLMLL